MPIQRCGRSGKGWRYGKSGKCYASKADAVKQMQAILASGYRENSEGAVVSLGSRGRTLPEERTGSHPDSPLTSNARKPRKAKNPLRSDPSRTATLRRLFESELRRRFARVAKQIQDLMLVEDAFGLVRESTIATNARWVFRTKAEQIAAFLKWLQGVLKDEVLAGKDDGLGEAYWRKFVEEAYAKGQGRAFDDVRVPAVQKDLSWYNGTKEEFLRSSFGRPMSIEKVQLMAGRVFTDLKGVTEAMAVVVSRELTEGFARGDNPHVLARRLKDELGFGSNRAATIARTEVIRAHAEGQLDAMERLGVTEVGVMVEWDTAGDGRVCRLCQVMQGVVLTIKEARGMIPRHPNCRCVHLPANVGEPKKEQVRRKEEIQAAITESLKSEKPKKRTLAEQRKRTKWVGPDKRIAKKRPVSVVNYNPNQPRDAQGRWGSGGGGSLKLPAVGEAVSVKGSKYWAEPFDSEDAFPPAIAQYEIQDDGTIFYTGRNGSEGVVTGTPEQAAKWMADVREEVTARPPSSHVSRNWSPEDGGTENIAMAEAVVKKTADTFAIEAPTTQFYVVEKPLESGSHGPSSVSLANAHESSPMTSLRFKTDVSQQVHTAAHETVHAVYATAPDIGAIYMGELAKSGESISLYHDLGGHHEGLMDLGASYVHSPAQLKEYSPALYSIADRWAQAMSIRRPISVVNYNPNQPRDALGRWGSGGGSGKSFKVQLGYAKGDGTYEDVPSDEVASKVTKAMANAIDVLEQAGVGTDGITDLKIVTTDNPDRAGAIATGKGLTYYHHVNSETALQTTIDEAKKSRSEGTVPLFTAESLEDLLVHEMGHNISRKFSGDEWQSLERLWEQNSGSVNNLPSFYAQENSSEMWAESVVATVRGYGFGGSAKGYESDSTAVEDFVRDKLKIGSRR